MPVDHCENAFFQGFQSGQVTMKQQRLMKLEAIRGFAAFYVVLFHVLPQKIEWMGINFGLLFRFGPEAVIIFFVLSGFVIRYTWARSKDHSFRCYFIRRLVRLYLPLVFIFLLGYLVKSFAEGGLADPEWLKLLGNLFMLQDVITQKPNVISGPYMGNGVLWSLSYEWWFYMLYFVLATRVDPKKLHRVVGIVVILAALSYLVYPFHFNRLATYFAIWWIGVLFADIYMAEGEYNFKAIRPFAGVLCAVTAILGLNLYLNFAYTETYSYPLVAYPFVEVRHFVFAIIVMFGAVIWHRLRWFGFDTVFGVFKYIAPSSYVIYISHHYLVVEASYLSFIPNKVLEHALYIVFMILFSHLLEVIIYNRLKGYLIR